MTRRDDELERDLRDVLTTDEYYDFMHGLAAVVETLRILEERAPVISRRLVVGRMKPLQKLDLSDDARSGLEQFVEALFYAPHAVPQLEKKRQAKVTLLRRQPNKKSVEG